jgi:hypothetical protein
MAQRDKRRSVKRRAIAAFATLALGFVIVLLGVRWLTEQAVSMPNKSIARWRRCVTTWLLSGLRMR